MIEIVKRHMVGGQQYEHIAKVKYVNAAGEEKEATRQAMVDWLGDKTKTNRAIVYSRDRKRSSYVEVVHRTGAPDYIRTFPDSTGTDNLLALDTY